MKNKWINFKLLKQFLCLQMNYSIKCYFSNKKESQLFVHVIEEIEECLFLKVDCRYS
jgi:hypothetical protein